MAQRSAGPVGACAAAVGAATVVGGIYLRPFLIHPTWPPFGFDSYGYAWRASVVAQRGIRSIPGVPDRPAHPILVDLLAAVARASPLAVMRTLPAILALAIALAAGAVTTGALGLGVPEATLVAIAVGGSAFVAWTAVGYSANLAIDVLLLGAVALAVPAGVQGRPEGLAGACLMLAAAFLYHWPLAGLSAAVWLTAALLLRLSAHRPAGERVRTTARRLAATATVGGLLGAVLLLVAMPRFPRALPGAMVGRIRHLPAFAALRMPALAFPLTCPLAVAAAVGLARHRHQVRRAAATVLATWAGAGALGVSAWYVLKIPTPPYRWAIFGLPVPLLAAPAPAGLVQGPVRSRARRAAAVCLSACVAAWLVARGTWVWWEHRPPQRPELYRELDAVTSYALSLRRPTRLVLLTRRSHRGPILAGLSPDLAGRVLFRAPPGPSRSVRRAAVLVLHALAPRWEVPLGRGRRLAPGVRLIRGPDPPDVLVVPRPFPTARATVIGAAADLGVLWITGVGWAAAVGGAAPDAVWLAPALGMATLGIAGSLAARLGVAPTGPAAIVLIVATAALGVLATLAHHAGFRSCKLPGATTEPGRERCSRWGPPRGRSRCAPPWPTSGSSSGCGSPGSAASAR